MPHRRQASAEVCAMTARIIAVTMAVTYSTSALAADTDRDATAAALDRCLAAPINASTAGQTGCEAAALQGYDRRMNAAYATLMRRLPASAAARLRQSQRAWLVYRDAESAARSAIYATRRGTMFVPMEADAAVALVGDRARLLERYARALDIG